MNTCFLFLSLALWDCLHLAFLPLPICLIFGISLPLLAFLSPFVFFPLGCFVFLAPPPSQDFLDIGFFLDLGLCVSSGNLYCHQHKCLSVAPKILSVVHIYGCTLEASGELLNPWCPGDTSDQLNGISGDGFQASGVLKALQCLARGGGVNPCLTWRGVQVGLPLPVYSYAPATVLCIFCSLSQPRLISCQAFFALAVLFAWAPLLPECSVWLKKLLVYLSFAFCSQMMRSPANNASALPFLHGYQMVLGHTVQGKGIWDKYCQEISHFSRLSPSLSRIPNNSVLEVLMPLGFILSPRAGWVEVIFGVARLGLLRLIVTRSCLSVSTASS